MANPELLEEACSLLEKDVLRHLVALKMLNVYGAVAEIQIKRKQSDWALLVRLPVTALHWDRKFYPTAAASVIIAGTSPDLETALLSTLPGERLVVKTSEEEIGRTLVARGAALQISILSFTRGAGTPPVDAAPGVMSADTLDHTGVIMFGHNGYDADELEKYFHRGARRFWIEEEGHPVSACFVFQNYRTIWEIAGLFTEPARRGRGLARKVVQSALAFIDEQGLIPRYQVKDDNAPSIALARSLGLEEFLRQRHYLWERG